MGVLARVGIDYVVERYDHSHLYLNIYGYDMIMYSFREWTRKNHTTEPTAELLFLSFRHLSWII